MSTSRTRSNNEKKKTDWQARFLFVEKRLDSIVIDCHFVDGERTASEELEISGIIGSSPGEIANDLQKLVDRLRLLDKESH